MTTRYQPPSRVRAPAGVAALLLPVAALWLSSGQGSVVTDPASEALKTFVVAPSPPPPPPAPQPRRATPRKEGAAAPPALRAKPKEIVAPKPQLVLPPPPSIAAPTIASTGTQARAGAAPVPGPGTGAGGVGEGLGSGGSGDGDGGGGGGTPYEQITRVREGDWPEGAEEGVEGIVGVRFVIGVNGRLTSCSITRSSGDAALDRGTCPILIKRLRFRPELDARGRPVPVTVNGTQEWFDR